MTSRRDFLKQTTVIPAIGMLPGSSVPHGSPKRDARAETDIERLRRLCLARVSGRYEQTRLAQATARLDHELGISDRLGRVDEFLAVGELAEFAQEERIPLRLKGSGCSSIIPYLFGFSDVDPVGHQLLFERFRDPRGRWAPPFVIQVEAEHQERISRVASLGYGKDFAERTINFTPAMTLERVPWLVAELLEWNHGCTGDLRRIPLDDDQTFRLIQHGDTDGLGLFHLDKLRYLLPRLRPTSIDDLSATAMLYSLSIERGDLMEEYLQQAGEPEFPGCESPDILEALATTRGLILYQEQIMMLLERIGGICPGDGYDFIKATFKRKTATVAEYRAKFIRTAVESTADPGGAGRLLDQITEAAGYAFCRANYVAEAIMVYQTAYLKAHYRTEFDKVLSKLRSTT
jgi:DNA polymerase III alpha subunit